MVQVRLPAGTGSISSLLHLLLGANEDGAGFRTHVEGLASLEMAADRKKWGDIIAETAREGQETQSACCTSASI